MRASCISPTLQCDLRLSVVPGAKRSDLALSDTGEIKVRIAAPAIEGKANRALLRYLADRLEVPRSQLSLVHGVSSRHKLVRVNGLDLDEALGRLGLR